MIYAAQDTNKICYMILPEGIREDLFDGLKELSEKYGVSFDSFYYTSYLANVKQTALFAKLYDKGGLEEVKDSELKSFVEKNYYKYSTASVNLYTSSTDSDGNSTSKKFSKSKIKTITADVEALAEAVSAGSKSFEDASKQLKTDYKIEDSAVTTDSIKNKDDLKSDNADVYKAVKKLSDNSATTVTVGADGDSPIIYLVYKSDIKDSSASYIKDETNRAGVLSKMKADDLTDLLEKTAEDLKKSDALKKNDGAINKYDPDMFFVKVEETTAPAEDEDSDDSDSDAE